MVMVCDEFRAKKKISSKRKTPPPRVPPPGAKRSENGRRAPLRPPTWVVDAVLESSHHVLLIHGAGISPNTLKESTWRDSLSENAGLYDLGLFRTLRVEIDVREFREGEKPKQMLNI